MAALLNALLFLFVTRSYAETSKPCYCTAQYDPVCCDGTTYSNKCMAGCADKTDCVAGQCEEVTPTTGTEVRVVLTMEEGYEEVEHTTPFSFPIVGNKYKTCAPKGTLDVDGKIYTDGKAVTEFQSLIRDLWTSSNTAITDFTITYKNKKGNKVFSWQREQSFTIKGETFSGFDLGADIYIDDDCPLLRRFTGAGSAQWAIYHSFIKRTSSGISGMRDYDTEITLKPGDQMIVVYDGGSDAVHA
eukprot:230615_1